MKMKDLLQYKTLALKIGFFAYLDFVMWRPLCNVLVSVKLMSKVLLSEAELNKNYLKFTC